MAGVNICSSLSQSHGWWRGKAFCALLQRLTEGHCGSSPENPSLPLHSRQTRWFDSPSIINHFFLLFTFYFTVSESNPGVSYLCAALQVSFCGPGLPLRPLHSQAEPRWSARSGGLISIRGPALALLDTVGSLGPFDLMGYCVFMSSPQ